MLEQEQLDNVMIEMDGTDNKCKPRLHLLQIHVGMFLHRRGSMAARMHCVTASALPPSSVRG